MELSVVIPVFNEAGNVAGLLQEIAQALQTQEDYEVIVVDDASGDQTPAVLAQLLQKYRWLRVLRHERNCGQSAALLSGVRAARGRWIATLDGDGQNDPADIPTLQKQVVQAGLQGDWLLSGWRTRRHDGGLRRLSSRVANAVRSRLLGDDTPDTGCGLKLFPRELFLRLPVFDHMHRFLPALVQRAGGRVISVPVNHRPRVAGQSKYGIHNRLWVGLLDLGGVYWLQRRALRPQAREVGSDRE